MIGFQELNETTASTYNYYPARSTKVDRYFVIDMQGETKDVVVTFTTKTKTGLGDRTKRTWFCTVTAMRGKKGGLTIRDMGDQQKFQETLVKLVQEFMLKVRANAVSMRVQKKGSGKIFDLRVKTLFRKLRYGCETTKILNVGDAEMAEDYSFFVINKPGYNTDKLLESTDTINQIAAKMTKEIDISTKKAIIVTADMVPGFEEFHDVVKAEWIEETPSRRVTNDPMILPSNQPVNARVYRQRLEDEATSLTSPEAAALARVALGTIDLPVDLMTIAERLAPAIDAVPEKFDDAVKRVITATLQVKSREYENVYNRLAVQLQQTPAWADVTPEVQGSIARYTGAQYWNVNQHLLTGKGDEKTHKIITDIDEAFEQAGVIAHNIQPAPTLYRGLEMRGSDVSSILQTGLFATTAFMSTSIDPLIAIEFAECSSHKLLFKGRTDNKQVMADAIIEGAKMSVVFIIEPDGLPVYIPGRNGQMGENEFIVNRNTVFDADVIQMDEDATHAIIRLSVRDSGAYSESIVGVQQKQERLQELESLATVLLAGNNKMPESSRIKFSKPLKP